MFDNLIRRLGSARHAPAGVPARREPRARAQPAGEREVAAFLRAHGVAPALAARIYERYGEDSLRALDNPYRLARDLPGLGFARLDRMARALGVGTDERRRVEAGIHEVMQNALTGGQVFVQHAELVAQASKLLKLDPERIDKAARRMDLFGDFMVEDGAVYPRPLYEAEVNAARRLHRLATWRYSRLAEVDEREWARSAAAISRKTGLSRQERSAMIAARRNKVSIITANPGGDVMAVVRTLIAVLHAHGLSWRLAAPSRAGARWASRSAEQRAETLQHLLGWQPFDTLSRQRGAEAMRGGACWHNRSHPIDADFIILAQADVLDLLWLDALVDALDPSTHLLFVGDPDRIPPAGAGQVLRDLVDSSAFPVTTIEPATTENGDDLIAANARRVLSGDRLLAPRTAKTFFILQETDAAQAAARVVETVTQWLPQKFGLDPGNDIRVLTAGNQGALGAAALNAALQAVLNPPAVDRSDRRQGKGVLRSGDPVVQVYADYRRRAGVGDEGRIATIHRKGRRLMVDFGGQKVDYPFAALDSLALGYAIDINLARGNRYRAVIVPLLDSSGFDRQRLYTALTCATDCVVLVGSRQAIARVIKTQTPLRRSRLAARINTLQLASQRLTRAISR